MRAYIAITADEYAEAIEKKRDLKNIAYQFAYAAYQIGAGSELLRGNIPLQTRGGLIIISDRDAPLIDRPELLSAAVLRECGRRGCIGAALDFENPPREDLWKFAAYLSRQSRDAGRKLYISRDYAQAAPDAVLLINTAISGGNFREYLQDAIHQINQDKNQDKNRAFALDIQRLRVDFTLPAPDGNGRNLNPDEFQTLSENKAVFFSPDLCARYFTFTEQIPASKIPDNKNNNNINPIYHAQTGAAHFVLFDDADTINIKLKIGAELGIDTAFFIWSEIRDLIQDLRLI